MRRSICMIFDIFYCVCEDFSIMSISEENLQKAPHSWWDVAIEASLSACETAGTFVVSHVATAAIAVATTAAAVVLAPEILAAGAIVGGVALVGVTAYGVYETGSATIHAYETNSFEGTAPDKIISAIHIAQPSLDLVASIGGAKGGFIVGSTIAEGEAMSIRAISAPNVSGTLVAKKGIIASLKSYGRYVLSPIQDTLLKFFPGKGVGTRPSTAVHVQESMKVNIAPIDSTIKVIGLDSLPSHVQASFREYDANGWLDRLGYKKLSIFNNFPNKMTGNIDLPIQSDPKYYVKYDVNPLNPEQVKLRGVERFIVGKNGEVYYTDSHYGDGSCTGLICGTSSFVRIK